MRNIGRASFRITRDGEFVTFELVFELFRDVNPAMNRFDLWKVTSAWWFYSTEKGEVPIRPDEIIHFKEWNPWNEIRGVTPLISLSQEIEQDQRYGMEV